MEEPAHASQVSGIGHSGETDIRDVDSVSQVPNRRVIWHRPADLVGRRDHACAGGDSTGLRLSELTGFDSK